MDLVEYNPDFSKHQRNRIGISSSVHLYFAKIPVSTGDIDEVAYSAIQTSCTNSLWIVGDPLIVGSGDEDVDTFSSCKLSSTAVCLQASSVFRQSPQFPSLRE
jgi:hypothetical protein